MYLTIVFGSNNDQDKVMPGIVRATKEIPGLEVVVQYASADNTPEKVERIGSEFAIERATVPRNAIISGAGMSNVLTGVLKQKAALSDIVFGIPITDSATQGVSSMLSTSEKPPLNPVLTVGLNNTYAALNIAYRFMQQQFDGVVLRGSKSTVEQLRAECEKLGLKDYKCNFARGFLDEGISRNSVVVTALPYDCRIENIREADQFLRRGNGVQVFCSTEKPTDFIKYAHCLDETEATGLVSATGYRNAVMVAAQLTQNHDAFQVIDEIKKKKAAELNAHKGLYIRNGEVNKIGVE